MDSHFLVTVINMEITTIFGLVFGLGLMAIGYLMDGGILSQLWLPSAALIVFGGAFGGMFVSFGSSAVKAFPKLVLELFVKPKSDMNKKIEYILMLSRTAKQTGIFSLEKIILADEKESKVDPFLKRAVLMLVDGADNEKITESMQTEIYLHEQERSTQISMFDQLAAAFPAFGMIGTIIGLIQVLFAGMDDPATMTKAIGVAFITTLYGVLFANLVFSPAALKLRARLSDYRTEKEMFIDAICAIRNGITPNALKERLSVYEVSYTKKTKEASDDDSEKESKNSKPRG